MKNLTYKERALLCKNPTARKLFTIIAEKKTNLALAADVTSKDELLKLARNVGSSLCVLKTHIDILNDYDPSVIKELRKIADDLNFIIFEDRKFADIGNTVQHQYRDGVYKISSWADIVNAHVVSGPGIIQGLKEIGIPSGKGLLLLAEMSSSGSLATGAYTQAAVEMAKQHPDFVIGFIAQKKLIDEPTFVHMTPGVNLSNGNDKLGQQYNTPEYVIGVGRSDVIIVGRGILQAADPANAAKQYQEAGWQAHLTLHKV